MIEVFVRPEQRLTKGSATMLKTDTANNESLVELRLGELCLHEHQLGSGRFGLSAAHVLLYANGEE